ncbi:MAG TPA: PAS domain S-box protein, partial [Planctomycetota bacterium]|nr:PAS domain S-box protein [Planctomycetota bacterium]
MSQLESPRPSVAPSSIPYYLLIASLAMVLAIVGYLLWVSHGRDRLRFQNRVQKTSDEIERRLETRITLIRATRGLFMASDHVSREEFRDFVATLNLPQRYPAIKALGYAKADGPDRVALSFIEPPAAKPDLSGGNAFKRARDDGRVSATSPAGGRDFMIYAPVYRRGLPAATVEERRAAIAGFVFGSVDVDRLLKDVLDAEDAEEIELQVDPGAKPDPSGWTDTRTLTVGGQPWTVVFRTKPAFKSRSAGGPVLYFLFAGLVFSAALFAVSRAQVRARGTAERIASRLTKSASALARSEDRGRRIIDAAIDAVVGIDLEGRITAWNPKAAEMFGWPEAEVLGKPLVETIIPAEYQEAHRRGLASFRATGHGPVLNRRIEVSALRRDGSEFPVELSITPLGTGEQATFSAFVRDLTERRKADASLRESLERFRIAAGTTTDFIYEWDLATGRVQWFGESAHELPPTRAAWEEIVHPEDLKHFRTSNPPGVKVNFAEYRIRRKDGAWRTWTDRAEAVVDKDAKPVRWI